MAKLCISTVVDSKYQHYIPLFVFCVNNSYPACHIKIFLTDDVDKDVCTVIRDSNGRNVEFIKNVFKGWKKHHYSPISWRFVIPPVHFKDYEYVYITDIDMMIVLEDTTLLDFHLNEMKQTGLCYSNSLRNHKDWKGKESLSGLHFCSWEWYEKTEQSRQKYAKLLESGEVGEKRGYDGHMLYKMVKESGLKLPGKYKLIPRHHGIHLGNFRLFNSKKSIKKRISRDKVLWWIEHNSNSYFGNVIEYCKKNKMAKEQIEALSKYCGKFIK